MRRLVPLLLLLPLAACGGERAPDPEVERLLAALLAEKPEGRLIAQIGPEHAAAAPLLLDAYRTDKRRHVRATLATALGNIGADEAATALAGACRDTDPMVRVASALAHWKITRTDDPGLATLVAAARNPRTRGLALAALADAPDVPARTIAPFVEEARPGADDRAAALRVLAAFGPAAGAGLPHIEAAVADEDPDLRAAGAWALHRVAGESERAATLLLAWMDKTEGLGRRSLFEQVLAIGADDPKACLAAARPWLDDDGVDDAMRCVAIHIHGEHGAADVLPRLRALARDDAPPDVRAAARRALDKLGKR